jgi:CRP/FNR family transcriptional regulator
MRRIPTTQTQKLAVLKDNRYFKDIRQELLVILSSDMFLYGFDRGEIVFLEGDMCKGLYILHRGSVKLYKISPQGRELVIKVYENGDSFNEVPVFDEGQNPVSVAALDASEIWIVDAKAIRRIVQEYPEAAQAVILNLSMNLRMLVGLVEELSFYQVTNRLARLIINSPADQLSGESPKRLTQEAIAARLGTVREVVARSLRELERSGAIKTYRRQIMVEDGELLKEWAGRPCDE